MQPVSTADLPVMRITALKMLEKEMASLAALKVTQLECQVLKKGPKDQDYLPTEDVFFMHRTENLDEWLADQWHAMIFEHHFADRHKHVDKLVRKANDEVVHIVAQANKWVREKHGMLAALNDRIASGTDVLCVMQATAFDLSSAQPQTHAVRSIRDKWTDTMGTLRHTLDLAQHHLSDPATFQLWAPAQLHPFVIKETL